MIMSKLTLKAKGTKFMVTGKAHDGKRAVMAFGPYVTTTTPVSVDYSFFKVSVEMP